MSTHLNENPIDILDNTEVNSLASSMDQGVLDSEKSNPEGLSPEARANDGGEGGNAVGPPTPVGFWDKSLNQVRRKVLIQWGLMTLTLATFILCVLSLFWGIFYHLEERMPALQVWVVDFDGQVAPYDNGPQPFVGPMIVEIVEAEAQSPIPHLGWQTKSPAGFQYDPIQVRKAVYNQDCWAAVVINPNATALLYSAIQTGNASYDPTGVAQAVYASARQQDTVFEYIVPILQGVQSNAVAAVGQRWAGMVFQNISDTALQANIAKAPQAISPAIGWSNYDLRPFYPSEAIPAVSIGLIYLIIISFFSFGFYLPISMKFLIPDGHPPLKFWQMIIWRYTSTVTTYFFLSLAYSLVSLAFQIPFSNPTGPHTEVVNNGDSYGHGTFVVYWMLNLVGMSALGLASENVAMVIGPPWTAMWLIFWVITNVAAGFYTVDLAPAFYHWGFAWPLHSVVEGSRTILFSTSSHIGLDFGILFSWVAVNTTLFPFTCTYQRWKQTRGKQKGH